MPPVSYYLKKAAGLAKASKEPGKAKAGKVTKAQITDIAKEKIGDLNCATIEAAESMIAGQAVSMGIEVVE